MLSAIIFDMDGVLIDSKKAWYRVFNKSLAHFEHKEISVKEFEEKVWAKNFNETAKKYFHVGIDKIRDYYEKQLANFESNIGTFPDTMDSLEKLQKMGLRIAVATNTHRSHAISVLKFVSLFDYFEFVLGGDDVKNGKPEPDILLKAVEKMGLRKNSVLYVGDFKWDRIACKRAGIKFVGYGIDGDYKINNLGGLVEIIAKHGIQ